MIMSSMAEIWNTTCERVPSFHTIKPLRKSQLRQKFTQKKYKNIKTSQKKCIVSVPNMVPNNIVMFNPMYKK